jgi:hypothetical protein
MEFGILDSLTTEFGILLDSTNTGLDTEILMKFVAPMNVISNQPVYSQDMLNLKRRVQSQNIQRWEIETNLLPENYSSNFFVHSTLNGYHNKIYVRMPQNSLLNYTTATNITVANDIAKNNKLIDIVNASTLVPGEFIRFGNHAKVYLVTKAGVGGSGIEITPSLRQDIFTGEPIYTGGLVTMEAYYDSTTKIGISYIDGILSDPGSVKLIEAL